MTRTLTPRRLLAAVGLALAPAAVLAASGQFTFVVGQVSLVKGSGQRVAATRGLAVDPGDRIETGADGMAQLTMVDNARLSLRPNTNFAIESYPQARDGSEGAILSLVRGTLRTFTGLIASTNRERFVMKTRVATVGIRGSGNILYACDGADCDPSVTANAQGGGPISVNHTIEGSHAVSNLAPGTAPGTPPQQGGAATLVTGPGQTVLVRGNEPPRYIPTPAFIAEAATNMVGAKAAADAATTAATGGGATRDFSPSDIQALPTNQQYPPPLVGNNGLGFPLVDASGNLAGGDPLQLRDIFMSLGSPFYGQARGGDVDFTGNEFRGYRAYVGGSDASAAAQQAVHPYVNGGTLRDSGNIILGDGVASYGRWENGAISFNGPGGGTPIPGSIHFIHGPSAFPPYLSEVLTGTATYTLAGGTSPTNQNNTTGQLGAATINVNFTNRQLDLSMRVVMPGAGTNAGGNWNVSADQVPISQNGFGASTNDRLVITNNNGQSSRTNTRLTGGVQGSFVGSGLAGIILGYGIQDNTSATSPNVLTGVAGFTGPAQPNNAPFREGRVSDPSGTLNQFIRSYATTDRPDEVQGDSTGRVTGFTAPFAGQGSHAAYALGTAQVLQAGADAETGLVWGRWSGGTATVNGQSLNLQNASLHYIFSGAQAGPVSLPLTGAAAYDVIGSTSPTDGAGHVGTLGSASLNANFTNRTVDAAVAININGQAWTGAANNMPIYRDQYFSAYSGNPIPGASNPAPLTIGCSPGCGTNATGSFDGFFAGASGQRAGLMYNLGGNQGAVAFGRRGG